MTGTPAFNPATLTAAAEMTNEKPFDLPDSLKKSASNLTVTDGLIIGVVTGTAAAGKQTLFSTVVSASIGAVAGLIGVKLGHWLGDTLISRKGNER